MQGIFICDDTYKKLQSLKEKLKMKDLDEVIIKLLDMYHKKHKSPETPEIDDIDWTID